MARIESSPSAPVDAVSGDRVVERVAERVVARIEITGTVQGVGFRPFVRRVATSLGLDGHVGNDSARVFIEVAGPERAVERLVERLGSETPPLAVIDTITRTPAAGATAPAPDPGSGFTIVASRSADGPVTPIPADTATCHHCLAEMRDRQDRRFGHPFITCTDCGPRFTIIERLPYDRPNTTMSQFEMCPACEAEYRDPADRRHHAQPISCHDCGPTLSFSAGVSDGHAARARDDGDPAIIAAANALAAGAIVAVKGVGGYHLACDATDEDSVAELRRRKHRADKPFAIMVADLDRAHHQAEIDADEAEHLLSPAAPIVLLRRKAGSTVAPPVAPGNPLLGIMVASSPIHHLLLARLDRPLVMTSANRGGEPIASRQPQLAGLADLYDAVLDHDRPIHTPCDDSVVRLVAGRLSPIRRSRGYAPMPVRFEAARRPVLATGGELKNTICLAAGHHAWVSQHLGDMENLETLEAFRSTVERFVEMYQVEPAIVAADAHPGYRAAQWARTNHPDRVLHVQHHHAHIASIMAEHRLDPGQPVLGFAFDGTGYGEDGSIWGGELLLASADGFERLAHLAPVPLPGGDAAIGQPCRAALAHLHAAGIGWSDELAPVARFSAEERRRLARQLETGFGTVATTSMGRLFDAVASLLDYRHDISYEAQAAIELELAATGAADAEATGGAYRFEVTGRVVSPAGVIASIVNDLGAGVERPVIAARFHHAVAEVVHRLALRHRQRTDSETVVLSGGVFQNALLTTMCLDRLADSGLTVLTHSLVPPNDGGLSLGQAYIAAHRSGVDQPTRTTQENGS